MTTRDGAGGRGNADRSPLERSPPGSVRREDVANYVADFTAELARLARSAKLDLLAYLLEIAHLEAETSQRRGPQPPPGP
ncbi:MAG: hypothetical protein JWR86_2706 [Enterovirga sp.]|jgi:hypothetical protein|nr:hypothetical protein [Enterovirga sp.]